MTVRLPPCRDVDIDNDVLRAAFAAHAEGKPKFTRRMAITIADLFGVNPMSMVWRLEKMGLIKRGSWEWFKMNGGITAANIKEVRAGAAADRAVMHPGDIGEATP